MTWCKESKRCKKKEEIIHGLCLGENVLCKTVFHEEMKKKRTSKKHNVIKWLAFFKGMRITHRLGHKSLKLKSPSVSSDQSWSSRATVLNVLEVFLCYHTRFDSMSKSRASAEHKEVTTELTYWIINYGTIAFGKLSLNPFWIRLASKTSHL